MRTRLILLLAIAVAGCGGGDDDDGGGGDTGGSSKGGSITISQTSQPDYLDPALMYTVNAIEPAWLVYTPLVTYAREDGAAGAELIPGLAEELPEISEDGLTYRLTLRKGLKYSDGSPMRASDFEHAIKRVLNLESGGTAFKNMTEEPPPGVGPYMFTESVPNRQFVMERNPVYDKNPIEGIPSGHIDTITTQDRQVRSAASPGRDLGAAELHAGPAAGRHQAGGEGGVLRSLHRDDRGVHLLLLHEHPGAAVR